MLVTSQQYFDLSYFMPNLHIAVFFYPNLLTSAFSFDEQSCISVPCLEYWGAPPKRYYEPQSLHVVACL